MNAHVDPSRLQVSRAASPASAVILVAGRGQRLSASAEAGRPKCMLEIGGHTLLEHQARALRAVGVRHIELVVGFARERVIAHARALGPRYGLELAFTHNPDYASTNTLVSLARAAGRVREGAWCLNGDVLFPPSLLLQLSTSGDEAALAIDPHVCGDEEVKVSVDAERRIAAIGKQLDPRAALGESIGVARFCGAAGELFADTLESMARSPNSRGAYYEAALQAIAARTTLRAVVIEAPGSVIEIDFPEDLRRAREHTYPRILAALERD